jgi:phospholipid/cholesterol/gamma-HCH transport system ATP-binding protein
MASKPGLLLFDDPTTGLDPIVATSVDDEIIKLRDLEHVTSLFVTHQIRDAFYIATHQARKDGAELRIEDAGEAKAAEVRFMVLHEGRIHFEGTAAELLAARDQYVKEFMFMTLPPW